MQTQTKLQLNKAEVIRQIRVNPADPELYELYYCSSCNLFVAANGLFAALSNQPEHQGHWLAWLPGQDSFLSGSNGHILDWLQLYRPYLTPTRYAQLQQYAAITSSANWVWILQGAEQQNWLRYLDTYLSELADSWLLALNGETSKFFGEPATIWIEHRPENSGEFQRPGFEWDVTRADPLENFLTLLSPS
jgi:hypothetical protein